MKKITLLLLLAVFFSLPKNAGAQVSADSLLTILQLKDGPQKDKRLVLSLRYYYSGRPATSLVGAKKKLDSLLEGYHIRAAEPISLFAGAMYLMQLKAYEQAESALVRAIGLADRLENNYLLYGCFTQLAFLQSLKGSTTEAVTSFRQARLVASRLNDSYLQIMVDINISDLYHRNKLYSQSLVYLEQAQRMMAAQQLDEPMFAMMILANKAENYFSLGRADSLAHYSALLQQLRISSPRLYTFQQRNSYSLKLLRRRYDEVLRRLEILKKDSRYEFDLNDEQNLARVFYETGKLDSAQFIALRLIAAPAQRNHPEVTLPLYELLGRIALTKADKDQAARHFDMALQQAKLQITRLVEVDTIAARLKLDEMQRSYVQREETFRRERLWLLFSIIAIGLALVAGGLLYRNIRQKRRFEQLLYEARRDELSFINSHEVRRHVSNILGIMDTITHSEDRHQGYLEAEAHLLQAAQDLDGSIRHITEKLSN